MIIKRITNIINDILFRHLFIFLFIFISRISYKIFSQNFKI